MAVVFTPVSVHAHIPAVYTNDNFIDAQHDAPKSFSLDSSGGFYGITHSGKYFTQQPVINNLNIRLHKFAIDEASFYMSDKGLISAPSDLVALSIYLTRPV
jgi:hypothetical protein